MTRPYYIQIVRKGVSTSPPYFKIISPITRIPPFLKIPHPPTLPANQSSQVFLINRNATVKLSSINTIHVFLQQHNVGFFIFKFPLKNVLGNVYINKVHARQCLYIISLYCREGFSHPFKFLCCIQRNPSHIISKQLGRKDFSVEQLPIDSHKLLCKQKNSISISQ